MNILKLRRIFVYFQGVKGAVGADPGEDNKTLIFTFSRCEKVSLMTPVRRSPIPLSFAQPSYQVST
jgi:hypothetical protein